MKFVHFTDINGAQVEVAVDSIHAIRENPPGQVMLDIAGGFPIQVQGTFEQITQAIKEAE